MKPSTIPAQSQRIWHYTVDLDGVIWHDGEEFDNPELLKFFMENLKVLSDGTFEVICQGERCAVTALDVPYVIQSIEITPLQIELIFQGGYRETLDPSTLFVGRENVLYCKIRNGAFTARFCRKTYFEIARLVEKNPDERFYLKLGGQEFLIEGV